MTRAPGLHDSFTEEGFWWLQGNEAEQVAGTLIFDPVDGSTLKLLGLLRDLKSSFEASFGGNRDEYVTIYGITKNGKAVTLLRAMSTSRQFSMPGIPNETWKSNLLIVGIHLGDEDREELFSKSYFRFEAIERWLQHRPFADAYVHEERSLTVKASKPREVHFAQHEEFEVTSVGSLYSNNKPDTRFTIDVFSQLAVKPHQRKSLNWHLSKAVRLQELAALCTGHYLPLTSLELRGPDQPMSGGGTRPSEVHVYARMSHPESSSRPSHELPVISGPELVAFNPGAVQAWFDDYEVFSPAISLFFTVNGQRDMFTNVRLLLAIQALEVFHRRTTGESVMPQDEFLEFAQALEEAIPSSASPRMRDKLRSTYQFLNEPSLNQRLKSIVREISTAFGVSPPGFHKAYLRQLVYTRNYYTHFSEDLRAGLLDGRGMYWASRRIILLLTLLFLRRLGIAASDIAPLLGRHREFSQLWASGRDPI